MIFISLIPVSRLLYVLSRLIFIQVVAGVGLATLGDYSYTALGFWCTLLGTFLAATKTIVTNVVQVGQLKLHPMDLLLRMSPLAFLQCLVFATWSGEIDGVIIDAL